MNEGIHFLRQLIKEGEGNRLDFKTTITSIPKIAKSLVAFANSRGGWIVVGVEDKGAFLGVDIDAEKYQLDKAGQDYCDPPIELSYRHIEHQGKLALIAEIQESQDKPHYAYDKKDREFLFVRVADRCIVPHPRIAALLESGALNNFFRTAHYHKTKTELIALLNEKKEINLMEFAEWKSMSEENALRALADYLFDGVLRNNGKDLQFSLA